MSVSCPPAVWTPRPGCRPSAAAARWCGSAMCAAGHSPLLASCRTMCSRLLQCRAQRRLRPGCLPPSCQCSISGRGLQPAAPPFCAASHRPCVTTANLGGRNQSCAIGRALCAHARCQQGVQALIQMECCMVFGTSQRALLAHRGRDLDDDVTVLSEGWVDKRSQNPMHREEPWRYITRTSANDYTCSSDGALLRSPASACDVPLVVPSGPAHYRRRCRKPAATGMYQGNGGNAGLFSRPSRKAATVRVLHPSPAAVCRFITARA